MTRTKTKKDKPMTFDKFVAALSKNANQSHANIVKIGQQNRTGTFYSCFVYQVDKSGKCWINTWIRDSYNTFRHGWQKDPILLAKPEAYTHYLLQMSNGFESEPS